MAENVYKNSPLMDPAFIERASAGETLAEALSSDGPLVEALAVSTREGNDLTNQGLGADLNNMTYGEIAAKYGEDVARQRINIQKELANQRTIENDTRTPAQILADSAIGAGAGFVGMVGGIESAILGGAGYVDRKFDEENTGLSELSVGVAQATDDVTEFMRGFQSDELTARQNLSNIESQLDAQDSLDQYQEDIESGKNSLLATAARIGRDTVNSGERILSDGAIIGDVVAQALGSLGPSARLAQGGANLARTSTDRFTRNEFAERLARASGDIAPLTNGQRIVTAIGVSAGVGAAEASGAYMSTANTVMSRTHEEMMSSPEYVAMVDAGVDPLQAQELVASSTALEAFGRQFPTAMALTLATGAGKFEVGPASAMRTGGVDAFREMGKQALEESLQGASGQFNENVAIRNNVDASQLLADGVGDALATGAIAGAGMSGVLAGPGQVANAGDILADFTRESVSNVAPTVRAAVNTATEAATATAGVVGEKLSSTQALDVIKGATAPVLQRIQDFADSSDLSIQVRNSATAKAVQIKAQELVNQATEVSSDLARVARDKISSEVPAEFQDAISPEGTVIGNVAGMMQSFAQPNVNLSRMSDTALLFASENFEALKAASASLPGEIKEGVAKIISSPDFQKVRNLASKIDLNTTQTAETEVIPDTVTDTVRVAKLNPTNVNPEFVNKILEQPKGTVSDSDLILLKAAAKISSAVNNHAGEQVRILNDQRIALSQKPAYQANPSRLPAEAKIEDVSRSVQVSGFKGARSVNDFAADIFAGAQSADRNFVNEEGVAVPVTSVVQEFKMFAEHMKNKTDALSRSAQEMDANGNGTPQPFRSLSLKGRKMVNPGEAGAAAPVTYRSGEKAVKFAQEVANDARVSAEVYNTLAETFPDLFPEGAIDIPTLNVEPAVNETETSQEESQTEVSEDQGSSTSEEEGGTPEAAETEAVETVEDTTAVESQEDVADVSETTADAAEKTTTVLDEVNGLEGLEETFSELDAATQETVIKTLVEASGLENALVRAAVQNVFLSDSTVQGQDATAFPLQKSIGINQDMLNNLDKADNVIALVHELVHILDENNGVYESTKGDRFKPGGDIYAEIEAERSNIEAFMEENYQDVDYFEYAFSIADVEARASELFAQLGAILLTHPDMAADFPAGAVFLSEAVARNGGEVSQEISEAGVAEVVAEDVTYDLPQIFQDSFSTTGVETQYTDGESLVNLVENAEYQRIAKALLRPMTVRMNARLKSVRFNKDMTVAEALASDSVDPTLIRDYKNTMFVNPETLQYDPALLSMAAAAVIDWMSGARATDPAQLEETLEDLGVNLGDLTEDDIGNLLYGVSPRQAAETIAKSVIKVWNLEANQDAPMINTRGSVETLVKELITVSADMGLVDLNDIPYVKDGKAGTTQTINVKKLKRMHDAIGLEGQNAIQKLLAPEDLNAPSIGNKIGTTDQTQSRGNVPLSAQEKRALAKMQDTPHFLSEGVSGLVTSLGFDALNVILGYRDASELGERHPLRASIVGKNLSIERDYQDAMAVVDALNADAETPVYYPVGISKVGRHQFKGINPQNNKILRAMVTPTHSTLDMTSQADQDAFWLTVAQAADLFKVENQDHNEILANVQEAYNARFGAATDIALEWVKTGSIDNVAFVDAIGSASMAEVSAVVAVAQLRFAQENGTESSFSTSLSFELDGKTDGPANMMSNFGQGELTEQDYNNFKRVGFFLGKVGETLNSYFSGPNDGDLYETTSRAALRDMLGRIATSKPAEKAALIATANFSAAFGDLKLVDGQFEMTRTTAKSPMTKTVYGSGVRGVASGIAQDMVLEFYEKMLTVPAGQDAAQYLGYPTLAEDFRTLFGETFSNDINWAEAYLDAESMRKFEDIVTKGLGDVLSSTAKSIIGDPITGVNDALIFATGVQTQFLQMLFQRKLEELAEKRASEGKLRRAKNGKPIIAELSTRDYNSLVRELRAYAPTYSNGTQTLAVGSFDAQPSNVEMSSTMDGKMRMKSTLPAPALAGVRVIPYLSIGRGDAMMMNTIYSSDNAPTDTLPVFDGVDMPVSRVKDYANQINEAVMQNWDRDVLADVEADFETFLKAASSNADLLEEAFAIVREKAAKSSVVAGDATQLLDAIKEMHRQNQARKAAFKRIPLSVDHMGGSNTSYTRGEGEMDLAEINAIIQDELSGKAREEVDVAPAEEVGIEETVEREAVEGEFSSLTVTTTESMISALLAEVKDNNQRRTLKAMRPLVPADAKVVTGSLAEVQAYRNEHYGMDGQSLTDAQGMFDVENNVIFLTENNPETMIHELVHMATFAATLAHYEGQTNDSVVRLEALMEEFLGLNLKSAAYNGAVASIVTNQNTNTPMAKAVAMNEFLAWTLSNQELAETLSNTETKTLTKKVLAVLSRLMGGAVSRDMFSNILFNARIINNGDSGLSGNNGNGDNEGGEVTPTAHRFSNFWIDLVRKKLQDSKVASGEGKQKQLLSYISTAQKLTRDLDFGGFNLSEYQKQTFMAIHSVLATEMRLDANSLVAMNKLFDHVTANLSPSMFGDVNAESRYQTVMDMFGNTKNDEDVSDAIAVLLALSQSSNGFRAALEQLPAPDAGEIQDGTVSSFLEAVTATLMNKAIGTIDIADGTAAEVLDELSKSILQQDGDREYALLKGAMSSVRKANDLTLGAMDALAGRVESVNQDVQKSDKAKLVKLATGSVALASSFLTESRSKHALQGFKNGMHMGQLMDNAVPVREFVAEVVGTDATNAEVVALLDRTNAAVSSARQAFREDLPSILAKGFKNKPTAEQWKTMHRVLGKTDFSAIFDQNNPDASMRLLVSESRLNKKIEAAEKAIRANFSAAASDAILEKTQQLADFMNGNGAGFLLWKNAYAINKLAGEYNENLTAEIDQLITMYALQGQDSAAKREIVDLYNVDPEGVINLVVYTQALNRQEEMKAEAGYVTEEGLLNGYKGFIPDQGSGGSRLIIESDAKEDELLKKGFVRVGDYLGESGLSSKTLGYYTTTVKQGGLYSQGVIQNAQASYRGVDATTGLTSNGTTSGVIKGETVEYMTEELNRIGYAKRPKETLIPVYDTDGILYYERALNPDLVEAYTAPQSNLALMLGAWAGRQVEEQHARLYNEALVEKLKGIYDNRDTGSDSLFVDLKNTEDKVYQDSWRVIPQHTKDFIEQTFGEEEGFMVRKDMVNLAVGYREASLTDMWTGKTRMPEAVQTSVRALTKAFVTPIMGDKGYAAVSRLEEGAQGVISAAKDIIVVRSLVVPFMNAQANAVQLITRGVGLKEAIRGTKTKLAEIEQYNENVKRIIELKARIQLAGTDKNRVAVLQGQKQAILDQNKRMSIAPMLAAGAYKNISEGITDMDVEITNGRLADWVNAQVEKLPGRAQTVAKYAMVSKDTPIYRGANKAVQYGDFIAKAIYYDHLLANGLDETQAMDKVNEEFVNFSVLPGRTRSYIESMGGSWFLTFKIRIMKIALSTLQNNPVGALITGAILDVGSPVGDNLVSVIADDRLDYSLGTDMLFGAPDLNPWINLIDQLGE